MELNSNLAFFIHVVELEGRYVNIGVNIPARYISIEGRNNKARPTTLILLIWDNEIYSLGVLFLHCFCENPGIHVKYLNRPISASNGQILKINSLDNSNCPLFEVLSADGFAVIENIIVEEYFGFRMNHDPMRLEF